MLECVKIFPTPLSIVSRYLRSMARKRRMSKLPQSVIHSSPYLSPALLSCRSPEQLLQFIQTQQYRQSLIPASPAGAGGHYLSSQRNRGSPSIVEVDPVTRHYGVHPKRNFCEQVVSERRYPGGYHADGPFDQLRVSRHTPIGNSSCSMPFYAPPTAGDAPTVSLLDNDIELVAGVNPSPVGMPPYPYCPVAGGGLVSLPPPEANVLPQLGLTRLPTPATPVTPPLPPAAVASLALTPPMVPSNLPQSPAVTGKGPGPLGHHGPMMPPNNAAPWTCDEGHELCPQFGLHQCACSWIALSREVVHDTPRPVPQPCFGSGEEILAISGSFPCVHFRFANLQPWLYYSICIEFTPLSAEASGKNRDPLLIRSKASVRFLPPGNHMPGHLWMTRRWSLQLEQIVVRIPHLQFGQYTPVIRLFATRGQLCQGLSLDGHPSDMIEASQNWYLSTHSFVLCPWGIDQCFLVSTAVVSNHSKIDDSLERSFPLSLTFSDTSDPFSVLSEPQSPPPCPREPWLDVEPSSCSSSENVWGPPRTDGGCSSDDPFLHRIFNNLFPEGYFDETVCTF